MDRTMSWLNCKVYQNQATISAFWTDICSQPWTQLSISSLKPLSYFGFFTTTGAHQKKVHRNHATILYAFWARTSRQTSAQLTSLAWKTCSFFDFFTPTGGHQRKVELKNWHDSLVRSVDEWLRPMYWSEKFVSEC